MDTCGGGINGSIMKPQKGPWPGKLASYIDVDDLDTYARMAGYPVMWKQQKYLLFLLPALLVQIHRGTEPRADRRAAGVQRQAKGVVKR